MVAGPALVTGATGGLGRVLVAQLLEAGRPVRASGRNRAIGAELGADFVAADLARDDLAPLVDGVATVFHLAARTSPWGPHAAFVRDNEMATERLLAAASRAGVSRFVFASTPSIYAQAKDQLDLTEGSPLPRRFANAYAETKYRAERRVLDAHSEAMKTIVLRPRAIVSPFDTVLLPRFRRAAARGRLPLPDGGAALIELTDARDACAAFLAADAAGAEAFGRAFNISGGSPRPLRDIVAIVSKRLGQSIRVQTIPKQLVLGAGHALEGFSRLFPFAGEPVLTPYTAMTLSWSQTFDLTAARAVLNWAPAYSPEQAIDWALKEIRDA